MSKKADPIRWNPMETAPLDGTLVILLIDGGRHPLEDEIVHRTIGSCVGDGPDADPTWHFAGWCWHSDQYCRGSGTPIGWLPLPPAEVKR